MVYPHFTDKETKARSRDLPLVASVCVSLGPSSNPITSPSPSPRAGLDLMLPGPTGLSALSPPFPHKTALSVSGRAKLHSVALLGTYAL